MLKGKPTIDNLDAYLAKKEYDLAVAALVDAIRRQPDNSSLRLRHAEVLVLAQRTEEAIDVYRSIAEGYIKQGFYARAIAVTNKILRVDPARTAVTNELAKLIATQREADQEARSKLHKASVPAPEKAAPAGPAPAESETIAEPLPAAQEEPEPEVPSAAEAQQDTGEHTPEEEARERDASGFFAAFPAAALEELLSVTAVRSFTEGDVIVREGDPGDSLYLIAEGHVTVRTSDPGGRDVPLARLGPGDFFGEVSVLTGRPRTATIVVNDPVTAIEIQRELLDSIFERHPEVESVLRRFYEKRAQATVETMLARLRGQGD